MTHEQFADRAGLYREEFRQLFGMVAASGSAVHSVLAQANRARYIETWSALFAGLGLDAVAHPACNNELLYTDREPTPDTMPRFVLGVWNDTNFPVVSLPTGLSPADGSPVGLQLAGLPYTESQLLQLVIDVQAATDYHLASPEGLDDGHAFVPPARREASVAQAPFRPVPSPLNAVMPLPPQ